MRRVHVQGVGRLPPAVRNVPSYATGPAWDEPQWSVAGPDGPELLTPAALDEAEMVQAVTAAALADAGLSRDDVGFICSGSNDYHQGRPFSFVMALDGVGCWPPKRESHVEMDGAFALYEAWVRLQHGDVDVALVYAYGRSSLGPTDEVLSLQLDPYFLAPLGPPPIALAGLQAQALVDAGLATEADFAAVVARAWRAAADDLYTSVSAELVEDRMLLHPAVASPLRAHDQASFADGAAAVVLVAEGAGPAIEGIAHCIDPMDFGTRDLTTSRSARLAHAAAGGGIPEVAELHLRFSPEALILRDALGLEEALVDPTGGTLPSDVPMVSGLTRVIAATEHVRGGAGRALAHCTAGPCLQQNLVTLLVAP